MARGANRVLKSRAENRQEKKEKLEKKKAEAKEAEGEGDNKIPAVFSYEDGKRSPFASFCIKAGSIFLLLYVWSNLYVKKYIPYKKQNDMLIEALKEPELIRHTVKVTYDYQEYYNKYMEEQGEPDRLKFFEKINRDNVPTDEEVAEKLVDIDEEEVPVKREEKHEVLPEQDEEDVEVIGDMREEIMGGEIYTVDEIFEKLGIEKIADYRPAGEYERNLLKEFRIDREMPDNIAKKADYYGPIIERGLKEDERFFVKKINDKKGYGLFANVDILPHEVLGVYTGVIQASESEKGKKYEWYYSTIPDREKEKMVELRVNGKREGSALRFVNHSLYYNTRIEYVPHNNQWYILFVSNRYIRRGEEVTVNYREQTKRMPSKIIDKWDKVEEEEYQKLYEEYMKLRAQSEQQAADTQAEAETEAETKADTPVSASSQEKAAPVKEEL